jgi:Beta-lactamase.
MSSTAIDLLAWASALKSGRVLTADDSKALDAPQIFVRRERGEDIYYGYGVRVDMSGGRVTEVMHSGSSDEGNTAIVRVLESGLDVAVLSRSGDHGGTTWSSYVAHRLPMADRGRPEHVRAR